MIAKSASNYYMNSGINKSNTKFTPFKGSEKTLANNEIKDIIKVFESLENRGIFLKGTT